MKRRYIALLLSVTMFCSQLAGAVQVTAAEAEDVIVEESGFSAELLADSAAVSGDTEQDGEGTDVPAQEDTAGEEQAVEPVQSKDIVADAAEQTAENGEAAEDTALPDEGNAPVSDEAAALNLENSEILITDFEEVEEPVLGQEYLAGEGETAEDTDQTVARWEVWGIPWTNEEVVKGWDAWINLHQSFGGAAYNKDDQEIRGFQAQVTDITIVNDEGCEALVVTGRDEQGISLHANDYGSATVRAECRIIPEEGEADSEETFAFEYRVNVCGDRWNIELSDTDGNVDGHSSLRPAETVTLQADVGRDSETDDEWPAYRVDWSLRVEQGDGDLVVVNSGSDETGVYRTCTFEVKGGEDVSGYAVVTARVVTGEENYVRAYAEWGISVQDGYYRITQNAPQTQFLEPGESTEIAPVLNWIGSDGTETVQKVIWRWEDWDRDVLAIADADETELSPENASGTAPFTVTKKTNDWTDIRLRAYLQEEDGTENGPVAELRFIFRELNYDVWFENLRGGNYTWAFSDEGEYTLSLNTENLEGRNAKIRWTLGDSDDEGNIVKAVPSDVYMVSEDTTGITVDVARLAIWMEENGVENGVDVQAVVLAGDPKLEVEQEGTWLGLAGPRYEYSFEFEDGEEVSRMPYENIWVDQVQSYYEENAQYPDGYEEEVRVTDVSVEITEGAKRAVTSVYNDENGGWDISLYSPCEAQVTIAYQRQETGITGTRYFLLSVLGDRYDLSVKREPDTSNLLPGDKLRFDAVVGHNVVGEDYVEDDPEVTVNWSILPEESTEDAVTLAAVDDGTLNTDGSVTGRSCIVTGQKPGDVCLRVAVSAKKDEGQEEEVVSDTIYLTVSDYQILDRGETENGVLTAMDQYLTYGETLTITPVLCEKDAEGNMTETAGDIHYRWEYDENILSVDPDEAEDSKQSFAIRRHNEGWTEATLIAELKDENGEYQEAARRSWYFNELNRDMWIDGQRGDGWSWVYTDEDQTLRAGLAEGLLWGDRYVEWTVYVPGEEGPRAVLENSETAEYYTVSEDRTEITLHGSAIAQWCEENPELNDLRVSAEVMLVPEQEEGEDPGPWILAGCDIGLEIREPSAYWEDQEMDTMLLGRNFVYENSTIHRYIENAENPQELKLPYTIINITSKDENVLRPVYNKDENLWSIDAVGCGEATITYTVQDGEAEPEEISFEKTVVGKYRYAEVSWNTGANIMLPGSSQVLHTVVYEMSSTENEDGEIVFIRKTVPQAAYQTEYINHSAWLVDVSENGYVTAGAQEGDGWITVAVTMNPEEGETEGEYLETGTGVYVKNSYADLKLENYYTAEPGGSVEIAPWAAVVGGEDDGDALEARINGWEFLYNEGELQISQAEDGTVTVKAGNSTDCTYGLIRFVIEITNQYGEKENWESDIHVSFCDHEEYGEPLVSAWPDCHTEGRQVYYCMKCGYQRAETMAVLEHDWSEWQTITSADCIHDGLREHTCNRCGDSETETVGKTGHKAGAWVTTAAATCTTAGFREQRCSVCNTVLNTESIPAAGHKWSAWQTVSEATVFAPELQRRTCSACGASEEQFAGAKLAATITLNTKSIPLKLKQSTTKVKVSNLAAGDYIVSWKSSNTKIVTVNKAGKITAKNKAGKAVVTVTLASGLSAKINVTVQKTAVKTTKISGLSKKITLKKGKKQTLAPVITPITSLEKVTYSSSNKKVATVSSKGVVTAKAAGTAKITVKSGKKKFTVTVVVAKTPATGISKVPSSVSIKKGKTYKLKAKLVPSASEEKITYTSSNKKVATVDKNGKITGKKAGKAVITVKAGKVKATCTVTVK